ncbi:MAG: hypothetical protein R3346_04025 [Candidatus Spechtbacterales bacterium]|nr:hypothetical protein [Candidatus Spechtbacterales bacterium]
MKNKKDLEKIIKKRVINDNQYQKALTITRENSIGKVWLIGSLIYKTLANELWGCELSPKDFDFIVESIKKPLFLPKEWRAELNTHGNPKLSNGNIEIDLISISNIHSIKERGLSPNISNYLSGVPLSVHSIAYDVLKDKLIGDIGIKSLLNGEISINNESEYEHAKNIYGYRQFIERYAKELGFRVV